MTSIVALSDVLLAASRLPVSVQLNKLSVIIAAKWQTVSEYN